MTLLILGVALWWAAHLFKRLAPGPRGALGDAGRGLVSVLLLAALVLMVLGYRALPNEPNLVAMPGNGHANNSLMLIALIVFGAGMSKGWLWTKIRHPMLWGVLIWSVAHLLVRKDLPSLLLFGGMGLWTVVEMLVINAGGPWQRPASGGIKRDGALIAVALVMYGLIAFIHIWLGYSPFLGNYA